MFYPIAVKPLTFCQLCPFYPITVKPLRRHYLLVNSLLRRCKTLINTLNQLITNHSSGFFRFRTGFDRFY